MTRLLPELDTSALSSTVASAARHEKKEETFADGAQPIAALSAAASVTTMDRWGSHYQTTLFITPTVSWGIAPVIYGSHEQEGSGRRQVIRLPGAASTCSHQAAFQQDLGGKPAV